MRPPLRRLRLRQLPEPGARHIFFVVVILLGLIGTVAVAFVKSPVWVGGFIAVLGVAAVVQLRLEKRRLRRLRDERAGESICTFARAIGARELDTWVVRGVYERLEESLAVPVPLRPEDNLAKTLGLDSDILDEVADDVVIKTGRSWDNAKTNPQYGKVVTVRDLVLFINGQPSGNAV